LKTVSGKEFARLLEKHGWQLKRVSGSHHVYATPGNPSRISVPIHGNTPLKIGLLKHFLKVSGIPEDEL